VVPFQNCGRQRRPVSKMAAITINIFFFNGHLGYRSELTDTNLKGDHLRIISAKFGWDWLSSFRGEDFFLIPSPFFLISKLLYFKPESAQIWTV
jgi:hypothetical protein